MRHPDENELTLHLYGESPNPQEIRRHLEDCEPCRAESDRLRSFLRVLDEAPVPRRADDYGAEVWRRVQGRLNEREAASHSGLAAWRAWFRGPRLALAASVAMLLFVAYGVGRWQGARHPIDEQVRERVLLVAVGEHLERSQRLLVEIVNASGETPLDVETQQARAGRLVADNRLYRQTAAHSGDSGVADLLEELERTLLEIANREGSGGGSELIDLKRRIARRGLLLKVRVIGERSRQLGRAPATERQGRVKT